jgi:imidazolonepropionase-like amidohydrolase
LADLMLIDGDPLRDLSLFLDRDNILAIMKDGAFYKAPQPRRNARRDAAE